MTPPRSAQSAASPALPTSVDGAVPASQSLLSQVRRKAFELKFLLLEAAAEEVERWAAEHLHPDPHAEPALGIAYRVSSLYLDTQRLDVFHCVPPHHRRKLRLRIYGSSPDLFLEQKSRRGDRVRKWRTPIAMTELDHLAKSTPEPDWPGAWFQERLLNRALRPTLQVGCLRSAYVGGGADGPLRLTLDRHLCGVPNPNWQPLPWQDRWMSVAQHGANGQLAGSHVQVEILPHHLGSGSLPLLTEQVVLELKYQEALPALFKRLVEEMALTPCPISKYRLAVRALNSAAAPPQVS